MAITIPNQIRSVDPYADHRFSDTVNRFNRIFTGGEDTILPFDGDLQFTLTLMTTSGSETIHGVEYSWDEYEAVKIGPGLFIKDDALIHVRSSAYLDFTEAANYVGSGAGFDQFNQTGDYFILIKYDYLRSIPASQASYVIAKQRAEFLNNREKYIYLGTASVVNAGGYRIDSISLTDNDELNSNALIERPDYKFTVPEIDGGDLD